MTNKERNQIVANFHDTMKKQLELIRPLCKEYTILSKNAHSDFWDENAEKLNVMCGTVQDAIDASENFVAR